VKICQECLKFRAFDRIDEVLLDVSAEGVLYDQAPLGHLPDAPKRTKTASLSLTQHNVKLFVVVDLLCS
jgi:hypothetical protein